jgi:amino acid adenylation domain-containing protein
MPFRGRLGEVPRPITGDLMDIRFDSAGTLVETLIGQAEARPDGTALRFVDDGVDRAVGYRELDRRARAIAVRLREHAGPGERAVLLLPSGPDYVAAFFGCLYAGVIAVPAYPPESMRPQHLARLKGILDDAEPRLVLTDARLHGQMLEACRGGPAAPAVLAVDGIDEAAASDWVMPGLAPGDIAFLQYTSGSTSAPKGVQVSHGNLLANERLIRHGFEIGEGDCIVSWLPLFHDMGLIGGLLQPIYSGIPCVLMSPRYFLERPRRWLETISRYRGTISGGPDFAFRLCCERIGEAALDGLDLGHWRLAFSGSEPIRPDTLERFATTFAPAGFRRSSLFACYGLAEATLFVTGGRRGQGVRLLEVDGAALAANAASPGTGVTLASCGRPQPGHELRLVDPAAGRVLGEGRVGEIWTSGPSVAHGYWRNPEASARTFVESDGRTWLRTGDLGFLRDGELFVTGRLKDMLILRGQNLYPQDLERAVEEEVEVVRKGRVAAFAVGHGGGEGIGIAAEVGRGVLKLVTPDALVRAIVAAVADAVQEAPAVVALLEPGALPKTSSGKLQRSACRSALEEGRLACFHVHRAGKTAPPAPEQAVPHAPGAEERLAAEVWSEVLGVPVTAADDNFFALGGNSISAVQVLARLRQRHGLSPEVGDLFAAPTLGAFARRLSDLRRAGAAGQTGTAVPAPLPPVPRDRPMELAPAQSRMWFHWKLDPQDCGYAISGRVRLRGVLRPDALQAAFDRLVARHESLRTVFREEQGRPLAVILPPGPAALRRVDLSEVPAGEREALAWQHLEEEVRTPFDLTRGPLLRVQLIVLGPDDRHLQVTLHHSIADGWSMGLLLDEFGECYAALCEGREPRLPDLPAQYAEFSRWQRDWLAGGESARQLAYWKARLGDRQPVLDLPADRPRPARPSQRGAAVACPLDEELAGRLRELARRQGVTLPMLLLTGFKVLLHRYSGQTDLRVGCTVANRQRVESERLIGFFVNMLVLRSDLSGEPGFTDLLRQVRDRALEAQAHQDLPFERLVEELQPARESGLHPLFQVAYDHQWQRLEGLRRLPGLHAEEVEHLQLATQFDLILHTTEEAGRLGAFFTYSRDRFEPETVERMARHWLALLRAAADAPDTSIARLPMLDAEEGAGLAALWNPRASDGAAPAAVADCLHRAVSAQARRRPEAPALTFEGRTLSYGELERRSNRLAWRLRGLGVGPDTLVGLSAGRSPELVIGMLAILKAGGGYLPLDPGYPAERLLYMQEDSGIRLLLSRSGPDDGPAAAPGVQVLRIGDEDEAALPQHADRPPPDVVRPDNLAYVIYTSGSTGRPKGVAVTHANVMRLFSACQPDLRIDEHDVWTLFHSYAFDFSVWEIFGALLHGGRLVIVPYYTSRSPRDCFALLRDEGATVLNQTPSAFRQLIPVALAEPRDALSLRCVIFGGEALEVESLRGWLERFGDARPRLVNMYGITETTVHVTWRPISMADLERGGSPIGAPLGDLRWYLLDRLLQPVPVGVAGEIHVGGPGLARGYLKRPGLTAERFVADPYGPPGSRLYRSGDLARCRADGSVEYLGRIDQQVKLRGFRIEPGEIEACLRQQPAVADAAVLLRGGAGEGNRDGTGDDGAEARLVAYVVADEERLRDLDDEAEGESLVGQWRTVFDGTYSRSGSRSGVAREPSFTGWNDSYGDRPIPEAEMREWLEATVARILDLKPVRLLEIGCGVGLLTQHLAPHCPVYRGTDLSERAVAGLSAWAEGRPDLGHVCLSCQEATDFAGIEEGGYDTVVINSVAQYFPGADYLVRVLEGAARSLAPGGRIFLGDLRPLHLQPLFHASVALWRADPDLGVERLRHRVARGMAEDGELLLGPGFFHGLRGLIPGIGRCDVQLRRGRADNELTRYRFDAVLHPESAGGSPEPEGGWRVVDGRVVEDGDLAGLERLLHGERPSGLRVARVPNRRLARDLAAWRLIRDAGATDAGGLRRRLAELEPQGADPEDFWTLAATHGYRARIGWSGDEDGSFDVELVDPARVRAGPVAPPAAGDSRSAHASDPLLARRRQRFAPRLMAALRRSLPAHMVPAQVIRVENLPLTVNGKLDRDRLAEHDQPAASQTAAWEAPESPVERALADIWREVLGIGRVGLADNFFELGGHSLLATQVASRIAADLGVTLDIRDLFEAVDLRALARRVEERRASAQAAFDDELASALDAIEGLSEAELEELALGAQEGGSR